MPTLKNILYFSFHIFWPNKFGTPHPFFLQFPMEPKRQNGIFKIKEKGKAKSLEGNEAFKCRKVKGNGGHIHKNIYILVVNLESLDFVGWLPKTVINIWKWDI